MALELLHPLGESAAKRMRDAMEYYEAQLPASEGEKYVEGRGLPDWVVTAAHIGFVDDPLPGDEMYAGHIVIPYMNANDGCTALRFRRLAGDGPKYTMAAGSRTTLFNAPEVYGFEVVDITEGEIDCLSLMSEGYRASGVPGASNWKSWYAPIFDAARVVRVWGDGDEAGDQFVKRIQEDIPHAVRVPVPRGMDVNSVLTSGGATALRELVA